jgi:drug/metabolite transporter (DMT)-like permease
MRAGDAGAAGGAEGPAAPGAADAGLLLMVVIWAVNFSVIKAALEEVAPLAFNALRFPLAALMVWAILRRRGPIRLPRREDWGRVLALGLIGNLGYQLFFIQGIDRTLAGNASLLLAGTPILTALFSAALGHERVVPRVWIGVVLTFLGMGLVIAGGAAGVGLDRTTLVGDLLMLGASLAWAVYTVGSRPLITRYGAVPVTAWTLWAGTVAVVLAGIPALATTSWDGLGVQAWGGIFFAGGLGIGLAYVLWYRGVGAIGNTRTATYSNLVPVLALLVAWAWLGEVPTAWQVGGAAVIISGVMMARMKDEG